MNNLSTTSFAEKLQARDKLPTGSEYEVVMDLAGEVFKHVESHRTPPVPKAYEVWYSYASENNDMIKQRIDIVVENGGVLSSYDIEQIHHEYLSGSQDSSEASLGLDNEMSSILELVESYLVSSKSYSGSLNSSLEDLSDTAKPEQLKRIVEVLISENKKMSTQASNLSCSLEQSKAQIQEMRASLVEARETSLKDSLTNLANRRKFEQILAKEAAEAQAQGTDLCLVMVDIDHFKKINDTFGHVVGDGVLKYVASLLIKNVKGRDAAARFGGEEFVIVLPQTKVSNAKGLVEQIRCQLEASKLVLTGSNRSLGTITASFGISQYCHGEDPQELVQRADAKLYEAKNAGRNRIAFDEEPAG